MSSRVRATASARSAASRGSSRSSAPRTSPGSGRVPGAPDGASHEATEVTSSVTQVVPVETPRCPASSSCSRVSRCMRPSSGSAQRVHRESARAMVRVAAIRGTSRCSAGRTCGTPIRTVGPGELTAAFDHAPHIRPRAAVRSTERSVDAESHHPKPPAHTLVPVPATPPLPSAGSSAGTRTTDTHCPYCSLQCGMTLTAGDRPATLVPADFPTNRGGLCSKGWTSTELLDHPERLTRPLVRAVPGDRTSPLVESTWEDALDRVVAAVERTQAAHGRDAVGCFGGGSLTNEQAYQFGKFARVALRTSAIDYNGRFCMSSAAGAANRAFGLDRGMPFPLSDIAGADVVVLVGSNPADTMPPAMQYFDEGRAKGAQHIVVDPRRTNTAKNAALHLQPLPGTDLALANGLLHIALAEGLVDEEYVAARTTGFDAVRQGAAAYWPNRVERLTGVPVADQRRTVFALARAEKAIVLTARGAVQHRSGTDTAQAWINLALALGLPGRPGSGWGTVTGQGNGQGGREHGQKADQLPGYRSLADPAARAHVAAVWGVDQSDLPQPGRSAYELLDGLGRPGGVRTLLVLASNVAVSAPDARRVMTRLQALDFLAVSDFFLSETAELADVVLPSAMWAEEDGTMTNLEGRVIRRRRALDPPDGVRDDLQLLAELAGRLGARGFSGDAETVFAELRRASAGGAADYSGISYRRIDEEQGVFWPCPAPEHPGTPRLFLDRFATPDGRARFLRVEHVEAHERPDAEYPYVLTTGRVLAQSQSGPQPRRSRSLQLVAPLPRAELHRDLARRLGIAQDDA